MSITRINEFQASTGKAEELFDFLKSLIPYISSSAGCQSCEVLRDQNNADHFVVLEKWDSIDSHLSSIDKFPKEDMQAAMFLFSTPPKGAYYHN